MPVNKDMQLHLTFWGKARSDTDLSSGLWPCEQIEVSLLRWMTINVTL